MPPCRDARAAVNSGLVTTPLSLSGQGGNMINIVAIYAMRGTNRMEFFRLRRDVLDDFS